MARRWIGVAGRRLLHTPVVLFAAATLVFLMIQAVPGKPFSELAHPGVDAAGLEHLRTLFSPELPLWQRYLRWLAGLITLDLGFSTAFRLPVVQLLFEAGLNTFQLTSFALLIQFVLGGTAGCIACLRRDGWVDHAVRLISVVFYSTPTFVMGLGMIAAFSIGLGWLPATQMHSIDLHAMSRWPALVDRARHLVLPTLALAVPGAAGLALYIREELRAVLDRPFLTTARSLGLSRTRVLLRHGARNALLPVIQLLGLSLPGLVGGSVVVETLFAWPGMGRLAHQAVMARDMSLIIGCTLVAVVAVILGSLVADLLSGAVDPRTRDTVG